MEPTHFPSMLWAGTDGSLDQARAIYAQIMADVTSAIEAGVVVGGYTAAQPDTITPEVPYNFSLQGGVGVVTVRGPLLNIDSPYARYRGATTYPDIQRAMVYAAQCADCKMILLDIGSGGGAVSGVEDTAAQIRTINDKVKPVYAIASDIMASAALWLGISAGKVFNGKTSIVGSIGVITSHMDYSKAMADAGIKPTVLRAGKYKALASPMEPLSATAEAQIQAQLDATYAVFANHVADMTKTSIQVVEATMAQGREFIGQGAVDAGLSSGLTSFDALVSSMQKKILDKQPKNPQNLTYSPSRNDNMPRTALTTQQVEALVAAGPEAVAAALAAAAAPAEPIAAVVAPAAAAALPNGVTEYLQGQVVALNSQVGALTAQLGAAQAETTQLKSAQPGLMAVVAGSIATMRIALNIATVDLTAASPEAILAEHAATSETYTKSFKAGGVAVSSAAAAVAAVAALPGFAGINPLDLAKATRINTNK